ncbi:glycosyltransferase 87 family protein [Kitasatospora sp. MAP5-34]|uniref:glycosyltransferase 87 family protein n=1 Tax=Kitasatospora sp. MAP5-34 TaxID=3035102 RepID=UPI002475F577|nr:glycosyltransferase 87 family protein [Kitasatospora sp. MAP5-34]MDH6577149.1 alpha-1,2-mannosyltransferase [Kitasatospora sp. MAP5-34]
MTAAQAQRRAPEGSAATPASPAVPVVPAWRRALDAPVRALREAPRRPLARAGAVALFSLLAYAVLRHLVGTSMVDMVVYRAEGAAVAHGHDLYALRVTQWNLPATYPPFAAMLFVPTTWVGVGLLRVVVTAGNVVLLGLLAHLSFKLVGWPRRELRPVGVVLVAGLGVWLEPVFTTLRYGQINLVLACLVLWDLTRPDGRRSKGLAIGIAAGIKLTPGLFAVYLLITGRVRAAFVAGFTFLVTFAIGGLVLPDATWGFWTKYLYDSSRVGRTEVVDNQSVRGAFARLLHTPDPGTLATVTAGLVAVAGLAIAAWAYRSARWLPRSEAWSVCCAAVTAVLISPISWTHHWVWCVPMLVLLAAEAAHERSRPALVRRRRWRFIFGATLFAFLSFMMWMVPRKGLLVLHLPPLHQLPASIYPVVGICFLAVAALRVHARRRAAGAPLVRVPNQRVPAGVSAVPAAAPAAAPAAVPDEGARDGSRAAAPASH